MVNPAGTERSTSPATAALWGWGIGTLLGVVKSIIIYSWNPLFFDSLGWSMALLLVFPGLVGLIIGFIVGLIRRGGPRR